MPLLVATTRWSRSATCTSTAPPAEQLAEISRRHPPARHAQPRGRGRDDGARLHGRSARSPSHDVLESRVDRRPAAPASTAAWSPTAAARSSSSHADVATRRQEEAGLDPRLRRSRRSTARTAATSPSAPPSRAGRRPSPRPGVTPGRDRHRDDLRLVHASPSLTSAGGPRASARKAKAARSSRAAACASKARRPHAEYRRRRTVVQPPGHARHLPAHRGRPGSCAASRPRRCRTRSSPSPTATAACSAAATVPAP